MYASTSNIVLKINKSDRFLKAFDYAQPLDIFFFVETVLLPCRHCSLSLSSVHQALQHFLVVREASLRSWGDTCPHRKTAFTVTNVLRHITTLHRSISTQSPNCSTSRCVKTKLSCPNISGASVFLRLHAELRRKKGGWKAHQNTRNHWRTTCSG